MSEISHEELLTSWGWAPCFAQAFESCRQPDSMAARVVRQERDRYANYVKLVKELAHLERQQDVRLQQAECDRWKQIAGHQRQIKKERDRWRL